MNDFDLKSFLAFLTKAVDFEIDIVETDESIENLYDFFIDNNLYDEDDEGSVLRSLYSYDRIISITLWLDREVFSGVVTDWIDKKCVLDDHIIAAMNDYDTNQFVFLEIIKIKKKYSRKTLQELEIELEEAVSCENYELAASLNKKIKRLLKKKK